MMQTSRKMPGFISRISFRGYLRLHWRCCIILSFTVASPTWSDHACVRCHIHATLLTVCDFEDRLTAWFVGHENTGVNDPTGLCEFPTCALPMHALTLPMALTTCRDCHSNLGRQTALAMLVCSSSLVRIMNNSEFKHSSHDVVMDDVPEATTFLMALAHYHHRGAQRAVEIPTNITNSKYKPLAVIAYRHHPTAVCRCRCSHRQVVAVDTFQVVGCRSSSRRKASPASG
jgi:hypothetical protein